MYCQKRIKGTVFPVKIWKCFDVWPSTSLLSSSVRSTIHWSLLRIYFLFILTLWSPLLPIENLLMQPPLPSNPGPINLLSVINDPHYHHRHHHHHRDWNGASKLNLWGSLQRTSTTRQPASIIPKSISVLVIIVHLYGHKSRHYRKK